MRYVGLDHGGCDGRSYSYCVHRHWVGCDERVSGERSIEEMLTHSTMLLLRQ
jgi:hypothetical protein